MPAFCFLHRDGKDRRRQHSEKGVTESVLVVVLVKNHYEDSETALQIALSRLSHRDARQVSLKCGNLLLSYVPGPQKSGLQRFAKQICYILN